MQALKQAAREGDQVRLDAVCEEWSVSANADRAGERDTDTSREKQQEAEKTAGDPVSADSRETNLASSMETGLETSIETHR
jgi:hypothetical protein